MTRYKRVVNFPSLSMRGISMGIGNAYFITNENYLYEVDLTFFNN
jgi:hypothetical protein